MAKKSKKEKAEVAVSSPSMDKDWQAENDADTLMRAGEICADDDRLSKAKKAIGKKKKAFRSVQDIIDYRNSPDEDEE